MAAPPGIGRLTVPWAAVTVALSLSPLAPASTTPRPDLVVTAIAASKARVAVGGTLAVTDAVRNRGRVAAPPSRTGYYLSRDRTKDLFDVRIGARPVPRLAAGASSKRTVVLRLGRSASAGKSRVLACADDRDRIREASERNCRATRTPVEIVSARGDTTPPAFAGLLEATTCIPGPVRGDRSAPLHLRWDAARDDVTPQSAIVYLVYAATIEGAQRFSEATYTTAPGVTTFTTPPLPASTTYYFVVRARDAAGNHDANRVERIGQNICEGQ